MAILVGPSSGARSRASYFAHAGLVGVTQIRSVRHFDCSHVIHDAASSDFVAQWCIRTILSNKSPEPTPTAVMPRAIEMNRSKKARVMPAVGVAQL